jgi:hypothetical protein
MTLMALWFAVMAIGFFIAAIVNVTKAQWGRVALFVVLAFVVGGAAGTMAAAA